MRAGFEDATSAATSRSPGLPRFRWALMWVHRWVGLAVGVNLVLIGLTGSFIVFHREIDAALNPALFRPASPEQNVTVAEVMRAAAAVDPTPISSIAVPDHTWPVWVVMHTHPTMKGRYPNLWTTMIDPSNGRVLGRRDYTHSFVLTIYRLHFTLLLYEWWGKELVGVLGFMLLGLALSGLYLWWPKPGRFWRSVSLRRNVTPQRFMIDLHNLLGFWPLPVFIVSAVTGIGIIFPEVVRPVVGLFSRATPNPSPTVAAPPPGTPQLSADAIVASARAAKPGYEIGQIVPPSGARNAWRVLLRPPGADPALRTRGAIWLDPWTGALVHDRSSNAMSMGERYLTEQLWLHNGATFGFAGRLLVFCTGFAPLILFVTGFVIWRNKRRAQSRMHGLAMHRVQTTSVCITD